MIKHHGFIYTLKVCMGLGLLLNLLGFGASFSLADGQCGLADFKELSSAPSGSINLCITGSASSVVWDDDMERWEWSCADSESTDDCLAYKTDEAVDGRCGGYDIFSFEESPLFHFPPDNNGFCFSGMPASVSSSPNQLGQWSWVCQGVNGGSAVSCLSDIFEPEDADDSDEGSDDNQTDYYDNSNDSTGADGSLYGGEDGQQEIGDDVVISDEELAAMSQGTCSLESLAACNTQADCLDIQKYWYVGSGQDYASCHAENLCITNNIAGCNTEAKCNSISKYWFQGVGETEPACHSMLACNSNNLELCYSNYLCSAVGKYFFNNACHEAPSCSRTYIEECTTQTLCESKGLYWYDETCNLDPTCDLNHIYLCNTEAKCDSVGKYWYYDTCHSEEEGNSIDPPFYKNSDNRTGVKVVDNKLGTLVVNYLDVLGKSILAKTSLSRLIIADSSSYNPPENAKGLSYVPLLLAAEGNVVVNQLCNNNGECISVDTIVEQYNKLKNLQCQ